MKRLAIAIATIATLTGAAHAASEEGQKLGTVAIIMASESVCEAELSPFMSKLKDGLLLEVDKKEVALVGASVIGSWKTLKDKSRWCAKSATNLKALETKYKKWEAANEEKQECTAAWCAHKRAHPELYK